MARATKKQIQEAIKKEIELFKDLARIALIEGVELQGTDDKQAELLWSIHDEIMEKIESLKPSLRTKTKWKEAFNASLGLRLYYLEKRKQLESIMGDLNLDGLGYHPVKRGA